MEIQRNFYLVDKPSYKTKINKDVRSPSLDSQHFYIVQLAKLNQQPCVCVCVLLVLIIGDRVEYDNKIL